MLNPDNTNRGFDLPRRSSTGDATTESAERCISSGQADTAVTRSIHRRSNTSSSDGHVRSRSNGGSSSDRGGGRTCNVRSSETISGSYNARSSRTNHEGNDSHTGRNSRSGSAVPNHLDTSTPTHERSDRPNNLHSTTATSDNHSSTTVAESNNIRCVSPSSRNCTTVDMRQSIHTSGCIASSNHTGSSPSRAVADTSDSTIRTNTYNSNTARSVQSNRVRDSNDGSSSRSSSRRGNNLSNDTTSGCVLDTAPFSSAYRSTETIGTAGNRIVRNRSHVLRRATSIQGSVLGAKHIFCRQSFPWCANLTSPRAEWVNDGSNASDSTGSGGESTRSRLDLGFSSNADSDKVEECSHACGRGCAGNSDGTAGENVDRSFTVTCGGSSSGSSITHNGGTANVYNNSRHTSKSGGSSSSNSGSSSSGSKTSFRNDDSNGSSSGTSPWQGNVVNLRRSRTSRTTGSPANNSRRQNGVGNRINGMRTLSNDDTGITRLRSPSSADEVVAAQRARGRTCVPRNGTTCSRGIRGRRSINRTGSTGRRWTAAGAAGAQPGTTETVAQEVGEAPPQLTCVHEEQSDEEGDSDSGSSSNSESAGDTAAVAERDRLWTANSIEDTRPRRTRQSTHPGDNTGHESPQGTSTGQRHSPLTAAVVPSTLGESSGTDGLLAMPSPPELPPAAPAADEAAAAVPATEEAPASSAAVDTPLEWGESVRLEIAEAAAAYLESAYRRNRLVWSPASVERLTFPESPVGGALQGSDAQTAASQEGGGPAEEEGMEASNMTVVGPEVMNAPARGPRSRAAGGTISSPPSREGEGGTTGENREELPTLRAAQMLGRHLSRLHTRRTGMGESTGPDMSRRRADGVASRAATGSSRDSNTPCTHPETWDSYFSLRCLEQQLLRQQALSHVQQQQDRALQQQWHSQEQPRPHQQQQPHQEEHLQLQAQQHLQPQQGSPVLPGVRENMGDLPPPAPTSTAVHTSEWCRLPLESASQPPAREPGRRGTNSSCQNSSSTRSSSSSSGTGSSSSSSAGSHNGSDTFSSNLNNSTSNRSSRQIIPRRNAPGDHAVEISDSSNNLLGTAVNSSDTYAQGSTSSSRMRERLLVGWPELTRYIDATWAEDDATDFDSETAAAAEELEDALASQPGGNAFSRSMSPASSVDSGIISLALAAPLRAAAPLPHAALAVPTLADALCPVVVTDALPPTVTAAADATPLLHAAGVVAAPRPYAAGAAIVSTPLHSVIPAASFRPPAALPAAAAAPGFLAPPAALAFIPRAPPAALPYATFGSIAPAFSTGLTTLPLPPTTPSPLLPAAAAAPPPATAATNAALAAAAVAPLTSVGAAVALPAVAPAAAAVTGSSLPAPDDTTASPSTAAAAFPLVALVGAAAAPFPTAAPATAQFEDTPAAPHFPPDSTAAAIFAAATAPSGPAASATVTATAAAPDSAQAATEAENQQDGSNGSANPRAPAPLRWLVAAAAVSYNAPAVTDEPSESTSTPLQQETTTTAQEQLQHGCSGRDSSPATAATSSRPRYFAAAAFSQPIATGPLSSSNVARAAGAPPAGCVRLQTPSQSCNNGSSSAAARPTQPQSSSQTGSSSGNTGSRSNSGCPPSSSLNSSANRRVTSAAATPDAASSGRNRTANRQTVSSRNIGNRSGSAGTSSSSRSTRDMHPRSNGDTPADQANRESGGPVTGCRPPDEAPRSPVAVATSLSREAATAAPAAATERAPGRAASHLAVPAVAARQGLALSTVATRVGNGAVQTGTAASSGRDAEAGTSTGSTTSTTRGTAGSAAAGADRPRGNTAQRALLASAPPNTAAARAANTPGTSGGPRAAAAAVRRTDVTEAADTPGEDPIADVAAQSNAEARTSAETDATRGADVGTGGEGGASRAADTVAAAPTTSGEQSAAIDTTSPPAAAAAAEGTTTATEYASAVAASVAAERALGRGMSYECPICLEMYTHEELRRPKVLSCGHSLCFRCVLHLLPNQEGERLLLLHQQARRQPSTSSFSSSSSSSSSSSAPPPFSSFLYSGGSSPSSLPHSSSSASSSSSAAFRPSTTSAHVVPVAAAAAEGEGAARQQLRASVGFDAAANVSLAAVSAVAEERNPQQQRRDRFTRHRRRGFLTALYDRQTVLAAAAAAAAGNASVDDARGGRHSDSGWDRHDFVDSGFYQVTRRSSSSSSSSSIADTGFGVAWPTDFARATDGGSSNSRGTSGSSSNGRTSTGGGSSSSSSSSTSGDSGTSSAGSSRNSRGRYLGYCAHAPNGGSGADGTLRRGPNREDTDLVIHQMQLEAILEDDEEDPFFGRRRDTYGDYFSATARMRRPTAARSERLQQVIGALDAAEAQRLYRYFKQKATSSVYFTCPWCRRHITVAAENLALLPSASQEREYAQRCARRRRGRGACEENSGAEDVNGAAAADGSSARDSRERRLRIKRTSSHADFPAEQQEADTQEADESHTARSQRRPAQDQTAGRQRDASSSPGVPKSYCSEHPDQEVIALCEPCLQLVCGNCVATEDAPHYAHHPRLGLGAALQQLEQRANEEATALRRCATETLQEDLQDTSHKQRLVDDAFRRATASAQGRVDELRSVLDMHANCLEREMREAISAAFAPRVSVLQQRNQALLLLQQTALTAARLLSSQLTQNTEENNNDSSASSGSTRQQQRALHTEAAEENFSLSVDSSAGTRVAPAASQQQQHLLEASSSSSSSRGSGGQMGGQVASGRVGETLSGTETSSASTGEQVADSAAATLAAAGSRETDTGRRVSSSRSRDNTHSSHDNLGGVISAECSSGTHSSRCDVSGVNDRGRGDSRSCSSSSRTTDTSIINRSAGDVSRTDCSSDGTGSGSSSGNKQSDDSNSSTMRDSSSSSSCICTSCSGSTCGGSSSSRPISEGTEGRRRDSGSTNNDCTNNERAPGQGRRNQRRRRIDRFQSGSDLAETEVRPRKRLSTVTTTLATADDPSSSISSSNTAGGSVSNSNSDVNSVSSNIGTCSSGSSSTTFPGRRSSSSSNTHRVDAGGDGSSGRNGGNSSANSSLRDITDVQRAICRAQENSGIHSSSEVVSSESNTTGSNSSSARESNTENRNTGGHESGGSTATPCSSAAYTSSSGGSGISSSNSGTGSPPAASRIVPLIGESSSHTTGSSSSSRPQRRRGVDAAEECAARGGEMGEGRSSSSSSSMNRRSESASAPSSTSLTERVDSSTAAARLEVLLPLLRLAQEAHNRVLTFRRTAAVIQHQEMAAWPEVVQQQLSRDLLQVSITTAGNLARRTGSSSSSSSLGGSLSSSSDLQGTTCSSTLEARVPRTTDNASGSGEGGGSRSSHCHNNNSCSSTNHSSGSTSNTSSSSRSNRRQGGTINGPHNRGTSNIDSSGSNRSSSSSSSSVGISSNSITPPVEVSSTLLTATRILAHLNAAREMSPRRSVIPIEAERQQQQQRSGVPESQADTARGDDLHMRDRHQQLREYFQKQFYRMQQAFEQTRSSTLQVQALSSTTAAQLVAATQPPLSEEEQQQQPRQEEHQYEQPRTLVRRGQREQWQNRQQGAQERRRQQQREQDQALHGQERQPAQEEQAEPAFESHRRQRQRRTQEQHQQQQHHQEDFQQLLQLPRSQRPYGRTDPAAVHQEVELQEPRLLQQQEEDELVLPDVDNTDFTPPDPTPMLSLLRIVAQRQVEVTALSEGRAEQRRQNEEPQQQQQDEQELQLYQQEGEQPQEAQEEQQPQEAQEEQHPRAAHEVQHPQEAQEEQRPQEAQEEQHSQQQQEEQHPQQQQQEEHQPQQQQEEHQPQQQQEGQPEQQAGGQQEGQSEQQAGEQQEEQQQERQQGEEQQPSQQQGGQQQLPAQELPVQQPQHHEEEQWQQSQPQQDHLQLHHLQQEPEQHERQRLEHEQPQQQHTCVSVPASPLGQRTRGGRISRTENTEEESTRASCPRPEVHISATRLTREVLNNSSRNTESGSSTAPSEVNRESLESAVQEGCVSDDTPGHPQRRISGERQNEGPSKTAASTVAVPPCGRGDGGRDVHAATPAVAGPTADASAPPVPPPPPPQFVASAAGAGVAADPSMSVVTQAPAAAASRHPAASASEEGGPSTVATAPIQTQGGEAAVAAPQTAAHKESPPAREASSTLAAADTSAPSEFSASGVSCGGAELADSATAGDSSVAADSAGTQDATTAGRPNVLADVAPVAVVLSSASALQPTTAVTTGTAASASSATAARPRERPPAVAAAALTPLTLPVAVESMQGPTPVPEDTISSAAGAEHVQRPASGDDEGRRRSRNLGVAASIIGGLTPQASGTVVGDIPVNSFGSGTLRREGWEWWQQRTSNLHISAGTGGAPPARPVGSSVPLSHQVQQLELHDLHVRGRQQNSSRTVEEQQHQVDHSNAVQQHQPHFILAEGEHQQAEGQQHQWYLEGQPRQPLLHRQEQHPDQVGGAEDAQEEYQARQWYAQEGGISEQGRDLSRSEAECHAQSDREDIQQQPHWHLEPPQQPQSGRRDFEQHSQWVVEGQYQQGSDVQVQQQHQMSTVEQRQVPRHAGLPPHLNHCHAQENPLESQRHQQQTSRGEEQQEESHLHMEEEDEQRVQWNTTQRQQLRQRHMDQYLHQHPNPHADQHVHEAGDVPPQESQWHRDDDQDHRVSPQQHITYHNEQQQPLSHQQREPQLHTVQHTTPASCGSRHAVHVTPARQITATRGSSADAARYQQ